MGLGHMCDPGCDPGVTQGVTQSVTCDPSRSQAIMIVYMYYLQEREHKTTN
jgi:hypothetical protein